MAHNLDQAGQGQGLESEQTNAASSKFLDELSQPMYSLASKTHPIDEQYEQCAASSRSTAGTVGCADDAQRRWDGELNIAYQGLKRSVNDKQDDALTESQRQWMKYRDAEFKAVNSIYNDPDNGSETLPWGAYSKMNIVKQRALELQEHNGTASPKEPVPEINKHHVDKKIEQCRDTDIKCAGLGYALWDSELNQNYKAVRTNLDGEVKPILKTAELEWLDFRDKEFKFIDTMKDSRYPGNRVEAQQSKTELVKQRALQLQKELDVSTGDF